MNERKDYYVYVLVDTNFNIRYVGEGCGGRHKCVSSRTKEYKQLFLDGAETLIICDSLTKKRAREMEQELINNFILSGLLINKRIDNKSIVNDLPYLTACDIFEVSESSPSGLIWKKKTSKVTVVNKPAGNLDPSGYWRVQLNGKKYRVHRLVWVLCNKQDINPELVVNHIDSNPSNNCISNLEAVSQKINSLKKIKLGIQLKNYNMPVGLSKTSQINPDLFRYRATVVQPDGKIISKSFSSNKYGDEVAKNMALNWRREQLLSFYGKA